MSQSPSQSPSDHDHDPSGQSATGTSGLPSHGSLRLSQEDLAARQRDEEEALRRRGDGLFAAPERAVVYLEAYIATLQDGLRALSDELFAKQRLLAAAYRQQVPPQPQTPPAAPAAPAAPPDHAEAAP